MITRNPTRILAAKAALYSVLLGSLALGGCGTPGQALPGSIEGRLSGNQPRQERVVQRTYIIIPEFGNKPFNLDENLLREYPEMQALSGIPRKYAPEDAWTVSATYWTLRTVESFLDYVRAGRPTGNIRDNLKDVGEGLDELAATGKYDRFVTSERQKFDQLVSRASELKLIGNKVLLPPAHLLKKGVDTRLFRNY